jgi:archaeal preflagellin peptidase FlaK
VTLTSIPILLFIAAIGGVITYEDIRYGKIRNRIILWGLGVGVAWNLLLFALARFAGANEFIGQDMAWQYLGTVALNATLTFLIGFLLWLFRFWAAGDAKLFAVLSLLLPLEFYKANMLSYFPSFVLFFNTFIVFFAILVVEFSVKLCWRFFRERQYRQRGKLWRAVVDKVTSDPFGVVKMIVGLIIFFLIIKWIRFFLAEWIGLAIELNKTMIYVVLFLMLEPLRDFFRNKWVFLATLSGLFGTLGYWAIVGSYDEIYHVLNIGMFIVVLIVFKEIYEFYTDRFDVRQVSPVELHGGMVLSDKYHKLITGNSDFNNERFGRMEADGMSSEQVEILTTWLVKNEPEARVEVCNTIPFTPGIVLGTVATIVMHGYIIVI